MKLVGLEVQVPIALPSASNLREHWAAKARRVKAQRKATRLALLDARLGLKQTFRRPGEFVVTLMRVAPRKLDDDNLASAFKAVRDEVADHLGVSDGSDIVEWRYAQLKGKPACVWIRFESGQENAQEGPWLARGDANAVKTKRPTGPTENVRHNRKESI